ncbi:vegetative incompatibility protein HET-E-1 [Diplogelasinospora grovesii]|uniref:Vegetative incompatibility protein HET-E-1 n=1 Tax=Diplogelasinospora grovesii TaxID=303347 RepID=A0AAN6MW95_9PEZI|nr:vegetative incompatibility protein HET-E-1 [Diplogelasinospora grovesii]
MRLINAASLEVEVFHGSSIPNYAILSHTWGIEEASFQEWTKRLTRLRKTWRPGFSKVIACCKQARHDGLPYVWVDTVCIDKSSSAELSEAINSMFTWYEKAEVCYVHLSDVVDRPANTKIDVFDQMRRSRWFTRGWTLQELLAPANVVFYSNAWNCLGTKRALTAIITAVTGIDESCLHKTKRLSQYSIAQRMAWAANRTTTREEDIAYCLLGIFGINMPLLYGEGSKAFRRLQEEIIKVSDDHSILAFNTELSEGTLLAHHPRVFATRGSRIHPNSALKITAPFSMTNAGLSMTTPLVQTLSPYWVLARLDCVEVDPRENMRRSLIYLPLFGKNNTFMRARMPVTLIRKELDESATGNTDEIQDLTTPAETSYIVSYFSRVYSVYGTEMDVAMKGFETSRSIEANTGFLITFPRGMANYQLHGAYPPNALFPHISFFFPTYALSSTTVVSEDEPLDETVSGYIVFKDSTVQPAKFVYVCLVLDSLTTKGKGLWACKLLPDGRDMNRLEDLARVNEELREPPSIWPQYHRLGNAIVAARTRFDTLGGEPCTTAILVEIVFDAHILLQENAQKLAAVELGFEGHATGRERATPRSNSSWSLRAQTRETIIEPMSSASTVSQQNSESSTVDAGSGTPSSSNISFPHSPFEAAVPYKHRQHEEERHHERELVER